MFSVGAISESRHRVLRVGNRSSLLQFKNVMLIVKSTINSPVRCHIIGNQRRNLTKGLPADTLAVEAQFALNPEL